MSDSQPEVTNKAKMPCKHNWQFVDEIDIGNSWGGAEYVVCFECSECGEYQEQNWGMLSWYHLNDG